jgi:5-methylcytosine-specific restriction protein B
MTVNELGHKLKEMYNDAPKGEQVTMIYLFGIKYHNEIKETGIKQVIEQSGILSTYKTELSKAVKLAKYVATK